MSEKYLPCRFWSLGLVPYPRALALQRRLHAEVVAGGEDRKGVTSMAALLGRQVRRAEVEPVVIEEMAHVFGLKIIREEVAIGH